MADPLICRVHPSHVIDVWPHVVDHIVKSIRYGWGECEAEDFLDRLLLGKWRLWVVLEDQQIVASATIELVNYPRARAVRVITLGGSRSKRWLKFLLTELKKLAAETGSVAIEGVGRPGWTRALKSLGFEESARHVLLRIDNGQ